jgi:hypothetical protein
MNSNLEFNQNLKKIEIIVKFKKKRRRRKRGNTIQTDRQTEIVIINYRTNTTNFALHCQLFYFSL